MRWPETLPVAGEINIRLQTPAGRIYAEGRTHIKPGATVKLGKAYQVADGAYQIVLMPTLEEYYEHGLRIQRPIDVQIANGKYAETPYGTFEQRRQEALDDAARRNLSPEASDHERTAAAESAVDAAVEYFRDVSLAKYALGEPIFLYCHPDGRLGRYPRVLHETLSTVATELRLTDVSALYAAVGEGNIGAQTVVRRVMDLFGGEEGATEDLAEAVQITGRRSRGRTIGGDAGVIVKDLTDVWVKLAKCCTPVPGDEILGFVTRGAGVSVHRSDCPNAGQLKSHPERIVEVEWAPTGQSMFLVNIQVEALDRARLLSDITKALSDMHVNILAASLNTGRDRVAKSRFTFEMADPKHLGHVLRAVRQVEGVFDAYRVTG